VAALQVETIEACSNEKLDIDPFVVATMRSSGKLECGLVPSELRGPKFGAELMTIDDRGLAGASDAMRGITRREFQGYQMDTGSCSVSH
jgi:hypothetical protein